MSRRALLLCLVLWIAAAPALAFPGGRTFSGRVKCTTTYNDGGSKADGSVTSLRMIFTHADAVNGKVQHCSGTLKLVPVT